MSNQTGGPPPDHNGPTPMTDEEIFSQPCVVYVGGPSHGMIYRGMEATAGWHDIRPDGTVGPLVAGKRWKVVMPMAAVASNHFGVPMMAVPRILEKVGIDEEGISGAVYELETTGNPAIARYIGQHRDLYDNDGNRKD